MGDAVAWFFILVGFAAIVAFVRAQAFDSYAEAWAAFRRWAAEAPERFRADRAAAVREQEVGIEVALPPRAVLDRAVEAMTRAGHTLEDRSQNSLTFARRQEPSAAVGCILLLLFVLPAILYFLFAAKTLRATLAAFPDGGGGSRIVVGGDDPQAVSRLTDWARALRSEPAGEEVAAEISTNPLDQIRRLAELRDAGLVTPEEFEAKKRDLLDRM